MEALALMDVARINAIGGVDLLYVLNEDGSPHWVFKPSCAYKFVVVDKLLIIAPIRDHVYLYVVATTWGYPIEEAKAKKREIELTCRRSGGGVAAAGEVDINGVVTGWKSSGFNVVTPEDRRAEIAEFILRLYETGELIINDGDMVHGD